jgi:mannose-1-phosphate guanylyltransferase/phosphomannomutase
VAVDGQEPADAALRLVLRRMGCPVLPRWRRGVPCFRTGGSGLSLSARDESGAQLTPAQLLAAVALVELESGSGRLAVTDETGAAAELLAAGFSRPLLRLGRDGEEAVRLYRALPWLYDGVFAAARLCARMRACGESLEQLCRKTPHLTGTAQELAVHSAPDALLARLLALDPGWTAVGRTLRRRTALGWVSLIPLRHPAVKVLAESEDMEAAAELCQRTLSRVQQLDGQTK